MKFSLIEIIITFFLINYINCQIDTTKENEIKAFISLNKEEKLTTEKKFEISENPKISIIIPIYNNEQSITSTIRSIQNQNLLDIEIVCINDHSNDTSLKILKNLQKNDPRIGVIRNKSNRGILYNLIDGAMQSSGEYVLFMYPGDYLSRSDALLKLYDIATKDYAKKLEIVNFQACDFEIINGEIHIKNLISEIDKSNLTTMIRQPDIENYYYNNFKNRKYEVIFDKMYRKAVIKRMEKFIGPNIYNLNINYFHEYILNFANIVKAKSLAYIEDIFYCHLINNKINNEWEIIDDKLKTPQITNKNFIDYILITERIFDLTSQEVKSIQLRENILKKIGDEQILNALARSLYFDRYISLYEQLIKWKLIDKETKKRNKQIVKYVMVYELDPEKKFGYITEEEDDDEEDDFNGYDYL